MAGLSFENRSQPGELSDQSPEHVNEFTEICSLPGYKACVIAEVLAMTERPYWLQTDLVIIVLGLALIGAVIRIAP